MERFPSSLIKLLVVLVAVAAGITYLLFDQAAAETAAQTVASGGGGSDAASWAMIAAAIASGLATLGAGYAVAVVGSAAMGALAEKPELIGRVLIVVGLAEGVAIYGLIVAVLILNKV